jgi:hypothetical protein
VEKAFFQIMQLIPIAVAVAYIGGSYFFITLDRQRADSPSKDDTQVGIKLVLWAFIITGVGMAAGGIETLLAFALSGFKGGSMGIRIALAPIVVGAGLVLIFGLVLMPKTNNATMKQTERFAVGLIGLAFGMRAVVDLISVMNGVFVHAAWDPISFGLSGLVVHGGIGFLAIIMLGSKSGWTGPVPPQRMMQPPGGGQPPQGGGYPPQGGGYPPQGGGYPPQGGGYPPQGGGYPPQGGGYPPQGGGYPPQGGGGGGYGQA